MTKHGVKACDLNYWSRSYQRYLSTCLGFYLGPHLSLHFYSFLASLRRCGGGKTRALSYARWLSLDFRTQSPMWLSTAAFSSFLLSCVLFCHMHSAAEQVLCRPCLWMILAESGDPDSFEIKSTSMRFRKACVGNKKLDERRDSVST
jgi:hypothetical protein